MPLILISLDIYAAAFFSFSLPSFSIIFTPRASSQSIVASHIRHMPLSLFAIFLFAAFIFIYVAAAELRGKSGVVLRHMLSMFTLYCFRHAMPYVRHAAATPR